MKGLMFAVFCGVLLMPWPTWAVSKRPPETPVTINSGRPIADLRPLLADTNNLEITHVFLCRRTASKCYETLWDIDLPDGWIQPQIELLGDYPGALVRTQNRKALQPGGSYNLFIHFNERSRLHQQTVDNTVTEFCLEEKSDALRVLTRADCRARRIAAQHQGGPAR
ncbi:MULTISPECIES: hypothetical protein [Pseudomonas]|uniref:hypothetical protein n=1 Tax=Pseudomonas TaxID=286 RepID=UPI000C9BC73F|nr:MULTISPECIES: hypothetical protein [Pseudomonas]MCY7263781.1 hypothetical protein [Pseudomonas protegens]PNG36643.1 hypothetical protein A1395_30250 [Pseudomonas protegens]